MAKAWQFYDATGALRNVKSAKLYAADGTLHNIARGMFYDAGGVLRTFFQPTNKLVTFTTSALSVSGLAAPANYGIGARTAKAALGMDVGGGKPVGGAGTLVGNLTTPNDTPLPFPAIYAANLMLVGDSGGSFNPGSSTGTTWPSDWFFFQPTNSLVYGSPWYRPPSNYVYFLARFADHNLVPNGRTACFGSVDFEDGVGPRSADTAIFQQFGEQFFLANYSNYGLWSWPRGAGGYTSTGLVRSLQFSGAPEQLQGWTWTQGGTAYTKNLFYNSTTALSLSGPCYAPVSSPYLSAGRGSLSVLDGIPPAGLILQAIHFSNSSASAVCHIFTNENGAFLNMQRMQGVMTNAPQLVTSLGPWSATSGGAAQGWVYSVATATPPSTANNQIGFY